MSKLLEIACFSAEAAIIALDAGAHRVELCDDFPSGGITPSVAAFKKVKEHTSLPVFIMIRPRPGEFFFTDEEFLTMKHQLVQFKSLGVNGFVFGILKDAGIDRERNAELVRLAGSIPCTFHRAFDKVKNMSASLEDVISCGFKRILTSGMNSNAYDGRETLGQMQKQSAGRIGILPGGGVRSSNCIEILKYADTSELHTSAITNNGVLPDPNEIKKILSLIS